MEELIITTEMREQINEYLGYELIKPNEVGHHVYDEAPGLGRIGIEGNELHNVATNKQLDGNGIIEWFKTPNQKAKAGEVKAFHCKLTTVSAKKAKILMASLFPDEVFDRQFLNENLGEIQNLRKQMHILQQKREERARTKISQTARTHIMLAGPNEIFLEGAMYYNGWLEEEQKEAKTIFGLGGMTMK